MTDTHVLGIDIKSGDSPHMGLIAVIPAYNEQVTIGSVVILARQYVERVIVVDDGSMDKTALVAKLSGAEVITLDENSGKAHALLYGLKKAREQGCKAVVMLDADGQHYTKDIPRIATDALSGVADLVIGSRVIQNNGRIPIYRQIGQKMLDLFTNIGTRQHVTDSQSGYRALSRKALDYIDFPSCGYNLESDMIAHFATNGLVIKEVAIDVRYNVPNKHKMNPLVHGMGVLSRLVSLISYRRPLLAFGIPGFALIIAGMGAEIMVFAEYYTAGIFHYIIAIGSAFVLVSGMLLLIAGLLLNTLVIIMKEHHDDKK
jgi:glycosyltransferase involved in cell wall biosynthesis